MIQKDTRRYVVVFDIDNTLCKSGINTKQLAWARKDHPECPTIEYVHKEENYTTVYPHVFLPHLQILFDYLLKQRVRIVFFSSGAKERNTSVIPELLTFLWGEEQYQTLKAGGQFEIFSKESMRLGQYAMGREGNYVKDLRVIIRDGESLLDAILVEDDQTYTAHDQEPCMYIIDLLSWYLGELREEIDIDHFPKNSIYYMLGLFKTYFEDEQYKKLPLRQGLDQILPIDRKEYSSFFKEHPFAHKIIRIGLEEVQKKVPDAILYKSREPSAQSLTSTDLSGVKIYKETKYESFVRHLIIGNIPLSMRYIANYLFEMFHFYQITDTKQSLECYEESIVNLIENLKNTEDIIIEQGTNIYDVHIRPIKRFGDRHKHISAFLSFIYVPDEEELENNSKIALQSIQPQVDMKKSSDYIDDIPIVGVGIAFSAKSFLAAYTSYKRYRKVHLTNIYNP